MRTYLDPDAVGPLPRSAMADDSDELAAARTLLRVPGTTTVEIRADDVIEVVDPNRPSSVAPVGYDTAIILPRNKAGRWVVAGLAASLLVLATAAVASMPRAQEPVLHAASAPPAPSPERVVPPPPEPAPPPLPASTVGTLLVDPTADGQRVLVDGVVLSTGAALVRCGRHEVSVGPGGTRAIEVPCGGEVTVYR
ncbi:MAG: hypothetical protein ACRELB_07810 [Polyangiaceae bacterium]